MVSAGEMTAEILVERCQWDSHRMLTGIRKNLAVRNKCGGPKNSKARARIAPNKDALCLGAAALAESRRSPSSRFRPRSPYDHRWSQPTRGGGLNQPLQRDV